MSLGLQFELQIFFDLVVVLSFGLVVDTSFSLVVVTSFGLVVVTFDLFFMGIFVGSASSEIMDLRIFSTSHLLKRMIH